MDKGICAIAYVISFRIIPIILSAALPWLPACQPGGTGTRAVSLEEAKQITAEFEGQSFVPPPKTITDITAILDAQKREDMVTEQAQTAAADEKPPDTSDRPTLAWFYFERGKAAREVGRVRQAIDDMTQANSLSAELPNKDRSRILRWLARVEIFGGRRGDAIRHQRQAIELARGAPVLRVNWTAVLARWVLKAGALEEAERLVARAEREMNAIRDGSGRRAARMWERRGTLMEQSVDYTKARILGSSGRFAEAEAILRSSYRKLILAKGDPGLASRTLQLSIEHRRASLGMNLLRQGRLIEAEIEVRAALLSALKRTGRYGQNVARFTKNLAAVMAAAGRYKDAEALARAALEINQRIGSAATSTLVMSSRMRIAKALAAQDRWQEALAEMEGIRAAATHDPIMARRFHSRFLFSIILLRNGRAAEAVPLARNVVERRRSRVGDKHYRTAVARGVLAMTLAATGERRAALREFAAAVPILLQRSRRSDDEDSDETARHRRLRRIIESYIRLLSEIRGTAIEDSLGIDATAEAFPLATVVRGQAVQRALIASAARASANDRDLADLVRREQDAKKRIGALYALFANAVSVPEDQQDPAALKDLKTRIDGFRGARAALVGEIERRFPNYAALMNPKPATIADARASLRPDEALIATYVSKEKTYVWAVPKTGEVAFAAAPLGRERVTAAVRDLRRALDPAAVTLGDIPAFDVHLAHRLYGALLEPVKDGWKNAKSLFIVAHGALGQLPFSVLVTAPSELPEEKEPLFSNYREVPWVVRRHAVVVLPSVTSLVALRHLPPARPKPRSFVGFGDPLFSKQQAAEAASQKKPAQTAPLASRGLLAVRGLPVRLRASSKLEGVSSAHLAMLPRLPDTADEVKSIAIALNADLTRDVFTGARASEGRVRSMNLKGYRVLVFATHGLVPGDLNGLTQPALALSSPEVAGGDNDGLLTMGEILGLQLDADWVVLSACNTASGRGAGAEAVSGLGRAFFYAGARALLVSNWPVETTSAKALTTDLFRRQAEDSSLSRVEALRRAMLSLIDGPGFVNDKGRTVFAYAHPIFWAAFSLIGDGRGATVVGN